MSCNESNGTLTVRCQDQMLALKWRLVIIFDDKLSILGLLHCQLIIGVHAVVFISADVGLEFEQITSCRRQRSVK